MDTNLQEIIKQSSFEIQEDRFVYAKAASMPSAGEHFMITQDSDEITVVIREENIKNLALIERNKDAYALFELNVAVPFYSVGLLASVSDAIAKTGMNILIVSTYSKDYIFVKEDAAAKTRRVLLDLGFIEK